jgi:hypothetical protein
MLPKIDVPLYELKLPLSKKKIKFRPFLVKEEKILLMAMESDNQDSILLAIKQILNNCIVSKINIDDLPIVDFEFLFMHLRARSVSELVELQYRCNNDVEVEGEKKKCDNLVKLSFNALEVEPDLKDVKERIELTPKLGIAMKYPTYKGVEELTKNNEKISAADVVARTIINSIDYIYDEESVYYAKDVPENELVEFIDSLTREQFLKVQAFFETLPKLKKEINFKCPKCQYEESLVLEGIQSFFG